MSRVPNSAAEGVGDVFDALVRAFVAGARWREHEREGATMWPGDRRKAEAFAVNALEDYRRRDLLPFPTLAQMVNTGGPRAPEGFWPSSPDSAAPSGASRGET